MRALKALNRVLTPDQFASAIPPLPPKLWRRMRRLYPDRYKPEFVHAVKVPRISRKLWTRFAAACKKWKVTKADLLTAAMTLFVKLVEQETGPLENQE